MVMNEVSFVYTISPTTVRVAKKEFQLGDLLISKGLPFKVQYLSIHRDPALWGKDAGEFKPRNLRMRYPKLALIQTPSCCLAGPQQCIDQRMALLKMKIVLSMILQHFQILFSPNYEHHSHIAVVTRPKYIMPLILM